MGGIYSFLLPNHRFAKLAKKYAELAKQNMKTRNIWLILRKTATGLGFAYDRMSLLHVRRRGRDTVGAVF